MDTSKISSSQVNDTQKIKDTKKAIEGSDLPEEIKEQLVALINLISDGIQPDELGALSTLLGSLYNYLCNNASDIFSEITNELKDLMKQILEKKIAGMMDPQFAAKISDKIEQIVEKFVNSSLSNVSDLLDQLQSQG